MRLTYNTTIHLSHDAVKSLLKEVVAKETNANVESITFDVTKEICGYGRGEHECVLFKGVTIRLGDKIEGATARSES